MRKILTAAFILFVMGTSTATAQVCKASWYGDAFHGNLMANNKDTFDMHNPGTVAHKKLPFDTKVRITNLKNGKSLVATVTDRGPYIHGRCVDLSKAGAEKLGFIKAGTARVRVDIIG